LPDPNKWKIDWERIGKELERTPDSVKKMYQKIKK